MSWRDVPADSIRWTAVIEVDEQFVVGAEGVSGPLRPDDPTRPRLAVRVTDEGVFVGDEIVVESPLPEGAPVEGGLVVRSPR